MDSKILDAAPKALKESASYTIKQGTVFRLAIASCFLSKQGKLRYKLIDDSPSWISIDEKTGVIMGKAPSVYTAKTYRVSVEASNSAGRASWIFHLTVIRETVQHSIHGDIQRYLDIKNRQTIEEAYIPQPLEYIHAFLMQSPEEERKEFFKQLEEKAKEANIKINHKNPSYADLVKIMTHYNPMLLGQMVHLVKGDALINTYRLTPKQLAQLFFKFGRPAGAIVLPVMRDLLSLKKNRQLALQKVFRHTETVLSELKQQNAAQVAVISSRAQAQQTYLAPYLQPS